MVDGIGNGPKNPQNVQAKAAHVAKEAAKGGIMGAAANMIGNLLANAKGVAQEDTTVMKGLGVERQADYSGSVDYQGTESGKTNVTGTTNYNGMLGYRGNVDYNPNNKADNTGTADYSGSVDYQGAGSGKTNVTGTTNYNGMLGYRGNVDYNPKAE